MSMNVRSLFSGVGGMDLGLERAGMNIISQCEKLDYRREVLTRHWPQSEISDDVESVSYPAGSADLLCGGFPCQDLSVAGRRRGLAGSRSGLFFEFARIADESVPDGGWILIENVPGLFSSAGGRDFGVLLRTLADIGFHDIAWRVCDSRYFGVPQRRRRVFILARRSVGHRAGQVLLEPEGDGGDPQEGRKKGKKRPAASAQRSRNGIRAALVGGGEGEALALNLRGRDGGSQFEVDPDGLASLRAASGGSSRSYVANGLTKRYAKGTDSDATDTMVVASALDRMRGGADDNDAQAHHIVPVGLGKDTTISGTLGKKGEGGGGLGFDREGAFAIAFNWQSGGDVRLGVVENEVPTLQKEQVPAIQVIVAPQIAAPLTAGHATGDGVSKPGRRMEDDKNLVVFGAWNPWNPKALDGEDPIDVGAVLGGSRGSQYSLNNMPLVAKCLTTHTRIDYDTEDFIVHAPDEAGTVRSNPRNNSDAATESKQHIMVKPSLFNPFRTSLGKGEGYVEGWKPDEVHDAVTRQNPPKGRPVVVGKFQAIPEEPAPAVEGLVRRLTPTECERLQGFPDGWTHLGEDLPALAGESSWYEISTIQTEDGTAILVPRVSDPNYLDRLLASMLGGYEVNEPKPDGRRYAAMGDAVTVPVAHWIGSRLLEYGTD